jgi:hypothetical protein
MERRLKPISHFLSNTLFTFLNQTLFDITIPRMFLKKFNNRSPT